MIVNILNKIIATVWWFYTLPSNYDKERRSSIQYRRKKMIVKNIWIYSLSTKAIIMCSFPWLLASAVCMVILLATTFLGFMILDETA